MAKAMIVFEDADTGVPGQMNVTLEMGPADSGTLRSPATAQGFARLCYEDLIDAMKERDQVTHSPGPDVEGTVTEEEAPE